MNKYRALLSSIFNYARRGSTYGLPINPVEDADRRRQPPPREITFYSVEEIEALARALNDGALCHAPSVSLRAVDEVLPTASGADPVGNTRG